MSPINYKNIAKKISGLTSDSRAAGHGYLFAAIKGTNHDGNDYIDGAVQAGAELILTEDQSYTHDSVEVIHSDNVRQDFAHLAAAFYTQQPDHIAAVTGTNGKTSVAYFVDQIWKALGYSSDYLGTLSGKLTTADPVSLHQMLFEKAQAGVMHLIMEASSHGLDQHRLDGVNVGVAAFTNLSRDHMDYHGDMQSYLEAKARLFSDVVIKTGAVVLNADCVEFEALKNKAETRGCRVMSYGYQADDLKLLSCVPRAQGLSVELSYQGKNYAIRLPLIGEFQAMNVLCALGIVLAYGDVKISGLIPALENLHSVPGRLQSVAGHPENAGVFVDFAHTPDALETVLKAVRPHCVGDVWCVFGAGGDRDTGKRPLMGRAASEYADRVVVTDDNPRSETPQNIRAEIMTGAPNAENISGRRAAIDFVIQNLKQGDVLVIAGKGHEQGQIFADYTEPFDDVQIASEAILQLKEGK